MKIKPLPHLIRSIDSDDTAELRSTVDAWGEHFAILQDRHDELGLDNRNLKALHDAIVPIILNAIEAGDFKSAQSHEGNRSEFANTFPLTSDEEQNLLIDQSIMYAHLAQFIGELQSRDPAYCRLMSIVERVCGWSSNLAWYPRMEPLITRRQPIA